MDIGQFCFVVDEFFDKFPNHGLMENKEKIEGDLSNRPCFFTFEDTVHKDILWLVPVSSKYDKYKDVYEKNIERYGRCPHIRFGEVLGTNAAFLIQNIFPITKRYIREMYIDKNGHPIKIDNRVTQDVVTNSRLVMAKVAKGSKLVFTKVSEIKKVLLEELESDNGGV